MRSKVGPSALAQVLALFLFLSLLPTWFNATGMTALGAPPAETITLTFAVDCATNSITPRPMEGQHFVKTIVQGVPCLRMVRDKGVMNRNWCFAIDDRQWFDTVADGEMIVEGVASETDFAWLIYDSALLEFNRFDDPLLAMEKSRDSMFWVKAAEEETVREDLVRNHFPLRKARFANRSMGNADFFIHLYQDAFLGISSISLRLRRVQPPPHRRPPTFHEFLDLLYLTLLNRHPRPPEVRQYEGSFRQGQMTLTNLLRNLISTREFLNTHVYPIEKTEAIRQLFVLSCGRHPRSAEINPILAQFEDPGLDSALRLFVEMNGAEIIEHFLKQLRRQSHE